MHAYSAMQPSIFCSLVPYGYQVLVYSYCNIPVYFSYRTLLFFDFLRVLCRHEVMHRRAHVHILACYVEEPNGPAFNSTLLARSLSSARFSHDKRVRVANICASLKAGALPSFGSDDANAHFAVNRLRLAKVGEYATHTASREDLIISLDADVVLNSEVFVGAAEFWRRFEEARAGSRVVYQGEPFCWTPHNDGFFKLGGCSREVLAGYGARELPSTSRSERWRCPRFLNSGMYAGRAADIQVMATLQEQLAQSKPNESLLTARTLRHGRLRTARRVDGAHNCFYRDDQCVATHFMLHNTGWIAIDSAEALFATATVSTQEMDPGRSERCVSCGNQTCRCSSVNQWTLTRWPHGASPNRSHNHGSWMRAPAYREACGIHRWSPLFIHFQGPCKFKLVPVFDDWVRRWNSVDRN